MPHILCRLRNVDYALVKQMLEQHKPIHEKDGMFLQHLWRDASNWHDVLFLFQTDNLQHAKAIMEKTHAEARKVDPNVTLPEITFLE